MTKKSSVAERYSDVVGSAELRGVRLVSSNFDIEPEASRPDQSKWKSSYECVVIDSAFLKDAQVLQALVHAEVVCKLGRRKILSAKCKYVVVFHISGDPDEEAARIFAERLGRFSAYPYFRAHFSHLISEAGLTLAPLPIIREGPRPVRAINGGEED